MPRMTKEQWFIAMDKMCKRRTSCTWLDLCGDEEPWVAAYEHGDEPNEFVSWWIEKYGLDEYDERGLPI